MADNNDSLNAFLEQHPDIEVFQVILPDIAGGLRGKWVTRDKIHKVMAGGLKLPVTSLAFDVWGRDIEALVFDSGDGDGFAVFLQLARLLQVLQKTLRVGIANLVGHLHRQSACSARPELHTALLHQVIDFNFHNSFRF